MTTPPAPCPPVAPCVPCPHDPIPQNQSGPDVPTIRCWAPQDCCAPSPCAVTEYDFLCVIRSLLPEGETFNNTRQAVAAPPTGVGVVTVGCARIGCEQLIFGGCCDDQILCDDDPIAPQLAVVDAYAAAAYTAVQATCIAMKELDPCTADITMRKWAKRMGLITDDLCGPQWSDSVLKTLLCLLPTLKQNIFNWDYLQSLAGRFGAAVEMYRAGDFSDCAPSGWWTMARDRVDCKADVTCPPEAYVHPPPWIRMTPTCETLPDSLNLVLCPNDIKVPDNCNLPQSGQTLPHDPELYAAFKWLLPKILPQPVFFCVYECDPPNCIPGESVVTRNLKSLGSVSPQKAIQ